MHAIRLDAHGPAEHLVLRELPDPQPAPGQVRVAVAAAGVHLLDTRLRAGTGPFPAPPLPHVPGREVAGTVDAIGDGVDPAWHGRAVVAHLGRGATGGYATHALVDVARLHAVPDGMDPGVAVALIGTGRTALMALDAVGLGPEDTLLLTGASGGIGHVLLPLAAATGATVAGSASGTAKAARVPAPHRANHRAAGWTATVPAPSVVIDGVGGDVGAAAVAALRPGGRVLALGTGAGTGGRDDVSVLAFAPPVDLRPLEERALRSGVVPRVHPFPLTGAAVAHRALEERATVGKVVLLV